MPQYENKPSHEIELLKQLGDMEGEVKEIQAELAALRKITHVHRNKPVSPIEKLQHDLEQAKKDAEVEKTQRKQYENKLKELETELNQICNYGKIGESNPESAIESLKLQVRDLREENDELKLSLQEGEEHLQEYRVKYLQAQQQVEELRNQQDIVDSANKQLSEQICYEIQKMKMQFQEKLQELAPLPDLLKGAQIKLEEAKQLQKLAEDNSEEIAQELKRVKEKLVDAINNLRKERVEKEKIMEDNNECRRLLNEKEIELDNMTKQIDELKCATIRLQEKLCQQELRFDEKVAEYTRLVKDLEELRDECTRSTSRNKERAECSRRYLQTQISELERQLIQSRAQCRSCIKERDDIRQRVITQLHCLQENFELVEIRYRTLYNQVLSMKTAHSQTIIAEDNDALIKIEPLMSQ